MNRGAVATGTRDPTLEIAAEVGWNEAERRWTVETLRRILPALNGDRNAFAPR